MPRFTIWQWLGIGFAGVCAAQVLVSYYDARKLLPKDIPLSKRIWRGWWRNLDLYLEKDREQARRSMRNYTIWVLLLVADCMLLMVGQ